MNARLNFCVLAGYVGGLMVFAFGHVDGASFSVFQEETSARSPGFPVYAPIADANPSIRHTVQIPMPTRLSVQRSVNSLSVSFDPASLRNVKIAAGQKMSLGLRYALRVYAKGDTRPVDAGVGYASINEAIPSASLGFLKSVQILNHVQGGIPTPGKLYTIEEDLSLFETDVPPQHMWSPHADKTYRVLWKKTLKSVR